MQSIIYPKGKAMADKKHFGSLLFSLHYDKRALKWLDTVFLMLRIKRR